MQRSVAMAEFETKTPESRCQHFATDALFPFPFIFIFDTILNSELGDISLAMIYYVFSFLANNSRKISIMECPQKIYLGKGISLDNNSCYALFEFRWQ